jgi:hypothetical protein
MSWNYSAIARILKQEAARFDEDGAVRFGVEAAAKALARLFALDDPEFNSRRFLESVGVDLS